MCLGNLILEFGDDADRKLKTVICSDALNADIEVSDLLDTSNCVIIHPQLNTSPKEDTFRRLRRKMMEGQQEHIFITANWAKGTQVFAKELASDNYLLKINNPWSTVYYKYPPQYSLSEWYHENENCLKDNEKLLVYGHFFERQRTAAWTLVGEECLTRYRIVSQGTRQPGIVAPDKYVKVLDTKTWKYNHWKNVNEDTEHKFRKAHYLENELITSSFAEFIDSFISKENVAFPLVSPSKIEAGKFMELLLGEEKHTYLTLLENEDFANTLLIVDSHSETQVRKGLEKFQKLLIEIEEEKEDKESNRGFPKHFEKYRDGFHFGFFDEKNITYNISNPKRTMYSIFAIVDTHEDALRYEKMLKETVLKSMTEKESTKLACAMCIFYTDMQTQTLRSHPKLNIKTTAADRIISEIDITQGGLD